MNLNRFQQQLEFLTEIDKLKKIYRKTILLDSSRQENSAEHTWHMAVAAMLLYEYSNKKDIDLCKVFKMILIHDIVEIDAGDVFAYDDEKYSDKMVKEKQAAKRIFGLMPEEQSKVFMDIWIEYEEGKSEEAKFAQALDSFMPILHNYQTKGMQWQKHNITSDRVLAKNKRIEKGSNFLWDYIVSIVQDSVLKGYLK
jgi:putative hydrolase of HD superfamily